MTGELVHGDGERALPYQLLPPEQAAVEALSAYLRRRAKFLIDAGTPAVDELSRVREVTLERILEDFPGPGDQLVYPSASLIAVGDTEHGGGFTPGEVEDSFDPVKGTALWYLGEGKGLLQLDLFADSKALRDAIASTLPQLFTPNEGMSGLHLRASPAYRCATIRYLLIGHQVRDTLESAFANERRVSATIRWDAPLYGLRCGRALVVRTPVTVT